MSSFFEETDGFGSLNFWDDDDDDDDEDDDDNNDCFRVRNNSGSFHTQVAT